MIRLSTLAVLIVAVLMLVAAPALAGSGCSSGSKTSAKAGCGPAEQAACAAKGKTCAAGSKACVDAAKTTTAGKTMPNGHPLVSVAEAQKCASATTAFFSVDKMTCNGCVGQINRLLGSMDGVCATEIDLKQASATVVYHAEKVQPAMIVETINKAGYPTSLKPAEKIDKAQLQACSERCANTCTAATKKKTDEKSDQI